MALYRSVKAPFLPKRGHTVDLGGKIVVLGGSFDGLRGPCIYGRRHGEDGDASSRLKSLKGGDVPQKSAIFYRYFKELIKNTTFFDIFKIK